MVEIPSTLRKDLFITTSSGVKNFNQRLRAAKRLHGETIKITKGTGILTEVLHEIVKARDLIEKAEKNYPKNESLADQDLFKAGTLLFSACNGYITDPTKVRQVKKGTMS